MQGIYTVTEDSLSSSLAARLVGESGKFEIATQINCGGAGQIKAKLPELTRLAHAIPVLILTDLDQLDCPPVMRQRWLTGHEPGGLLFRIAVRESESWLLADRDAMAEFASIPISKLNIAPDDLSDPKQFLLNLIRKYSPKHLQEKILPERRSKSKVGLGYNVVLTHYVMEQWSPKRASERSDSLARARRSLAQLLEESSF